MVLFQNTQRSGQVGSDLVRPSGVKNPDLFSEPSTRSSHFTVTAGSHSVTCYPLHSSAQLSHRNSNV